MNPARPSHSAIPLTRLQPRIKRRQALRWSVFAGLWLISLTCVWRLAGRRAEPGLAVTRMELKQARAVVAEQHQRIRSLERALTHYALSDQVSRQANNEIQTTLSERDQQIASLRADVAFYARLVGSTAPVQSLHVHSLEFSHSAKNTWNYRLLLSQNLIKGSISRGHLRFAVAGIRAGQLTTFDWTQIKQNARAEEQDYSFRYFEQLTGDIILPLNFTPSHVTVVLTGEEGSVVTQTIKWKVASAPDEAEDL